MSLTKIANPLFKLNSGHQIPLVGLGVFLTPPAETTALIYKALKLGYRHFDSAQHYENEAAVVEGIAKFLKDFPEVKRSEIFYTTKFSPLIFIGNEPTSIEDAQAKAKQFIEKSYEIAAPIGYIDLFLIHSPHTDKYARLGGYGLLQEGVAAGKIKSIGVSNYNIHHLEELFAWEGYKIKPAVDQVELNPWLTRKELVDYLESKDIKPQAFSPLTRGLRLDDPELKALAEKYGKTTGQILINWSLEKGFITLPKTVTESRLIENLDSINFKLSKEDVESLTHDDDYYVTLERWDPVTYQG